MFLLRLIVSGAAAVWSIVNMLMTAALSPVHVLDLAAAPSYWYINTPATLNIPRAPPHHRPHPIPSRSRPSMPTPSSPAGTPRRHSLSDPAPPSHSSPASQTRKRASGSRSFRSRSSSSPPLLQEPQASPLGRFPPPNRPRPPPGCS
ncbi:hypothetical protein BXZ70DRAFT_924099 [Cristinia sonorae]|uniref:Uncharacterized protein n=1 Tax=Cristinia sonorae TaxID=1940300 RepID=A0A8K0UTL5_9AGAR|nr:hypothetical protein BXZ70DRAFT_924099 [Cristinia sonorae]